ncbi:hypothetical protein [Arthrobacter sp. UYP6]|uniref:hypothetical protein n=1 Tax=Arthrobacter sp. UYP6 TaxID=1756378 RepID=UPI0033970FEB
MSSNSERPKTETLMHDLTLYAEPAVVVISTPDKAKLKLFTNAEGKLDAEYDPADLTEAAQMFVEEMRRVQGFHA